MLIRRARLGGVGGSSWHDFRLTRSWDRNRLRFRRVIGLRKGPSQPSDENPFACEEAEQNVTVLLEFSYDKQIDGQRQTEE